MQNGDYRKNPKKYRKSIEKDSIVWYNKDTEKITNGGKQNERRNQKA